MWLWIGIIAGILALLIVIMYNSFIRLRNEVDNSFAQIDVQLKRRNDLIPNLVSAVKGYMKHEKSLLENITKARTSIMGAKNMGAKAEASNMMTDALKSIFAVAENYPKLQASDNFKQLQEELVATEDKISYSRQHYNDVVMQYNTKRESFPSNMIAKVFNFIKRDLFETKESERKNVKVSF